MKMILAILLMAVAVPVMAVEFTILDWGDEFKTTRVSLGTASYHDKFGTDDVGVYIQTPVVEWERAWIGFGATVPVQNANRTRPHFSLATSVNQLGLPVSYRWDLELGAYWMASGYKSWGFQIGYILEF